MGTKKEKRLGKIRQRGFLREHTSFTGNARGKKAEAGEMAGCYDAENLGRKKGASRRGTIGQLEGRCRKRFNGGVQCINGKSRYKETERYWACLYQKSAEEDRPAPEDCLGVKKHAPLCFGGNGMKKSSKKVLLLCKNPGEEIRRKLQGRSMPEG